MPEIEELKRIAEVEFSDIVSDATLIEHKLRIRWLQGIYGICKR